MARVASPGFAALADSRCIWKQTIRTTMTVLTVLVAVGVLGLSRASETHTGSSIRPAKVAKAELKAGTQKAGPERSVAMSVDILAHGHPVLIAVRIPRVRIEAGPRNVEQLRFFLQARNKRTGEVTSLGQLTCTGLTNHLADTCICDLPPGEYAIELEWAAQPWGIGVMGEGDNGNQGFLHVVEMVGADSLLDLEEQLRRDIVTLARVFKEEVANDPEFRRAYMREVIADKELMAELEKAIQESEPVIGQQSE